MFPRPSKGGGFGNRDYTQFIKWTRLKVGVFAACLVIPYMVAVVAIALKLGPIAAVPMVLLAILTGVIAKVLYWLASTDL